MLTLAKVRTEALMLLQQRRINWKLFFSLIFIFLNRGQTESRLLLLNEANG